MAGYYPANTTVNYYPPDAQWAAWNAYYSGTTAATTQTTIWQAWNQQVYYTIPEPNKRQQEEMAAARKRAEDARAKAKELLLEHLSPVQRESFEKTGLFIVETAKKNRYQLGRTPVKICYDPETQNDRPVTSYCIHMGGNVPKDDELLGFKLMLEANEEEFLKTANATAIAA